MQMSATSVKEFKFSEYDSKTHAQTLQLSEEENSQNEFEIRVVQ